MVLSEEYFDDILLKCFRCSFLGQVWTSVREWLDQGGKRCDVARASPQLQLFAHLHLSFNFPTVALLPCSFSLLSSFLIVKVPHDKITKDNADRNFKHISLSTCGKIVCFTFSFFFSFFAPPPLLLCATCWLVWPRTAKAESRRPHTARRGRANIFSFTNQIHSHFHTNTFSFPHKYIFVSTQISKSRRWWKTLVASDDAAVSSGPK